MESPRGPDRRTPRRKVHAKFGDLWIYSNRIVEALKANPGGKAKWLSQELENNYALVVDWQALKKFCDQESLWGCYYSVTGSCRQRQGC